MFPGQGKRGGIWFGKGAELKGFPLLRFATECQSKRRRVVHGEDIDSGTDGRSVSREAVVYRSPFGCRPGSWGSGWGDGKRKGSKRFLAMAGRSDIIRANLGADRLGVPVIVAKTIRGRKTRGRSRVFHP
jgi:hypothetical protein